MQQYGIVVLGSRYDCISMNGCDLAPKKLLRGAKEAMGHLIKQPSQLDVNSWDDKTSSAFDIAQQLGSKEAFAAIRSCAQQQPGCWRADCGNTSPSQPS